MSSAYTFWFGDLNYRINLSYEVGVQQAYDRNVSESGLLRLRSNS